MQMPPAKAEGLRLRSFFFECHPAEIWLRYNSIPHPKHVLKIPRSQYWVKSNARAPLYTFAVYCCRIVEQKADAAARHALFRKLCGVSRSSTSHELPWVHVLFVSLPGSTGIS